MIVCLFPRISTLGHLSRCIRIVFNIFIYPDSMWTVLHVHLSTPLNYSPCNFQLVVVDAQLSAVACHKSWGQLLVLHHTGTINCAVVATASHCRYYDINHWTNVYPPCTHRTQFARYHSVVENNRTFSVCIAYLRLFKLVVATRWLI